MLVDWMRNLEVGIPALIEDGIKLLVYAGECDLIRNWLGYCLFRWVDAMAWSGQKEFVASLEVPSVVDGSEARVLKTQFLKVHYACHMVPMDQPAQGSIGDAEETRGKLSEAADSEIWVAEM